MTKPIPHLSKSKFLAGLQCSRRLWLTCHDPLPDEAGSEFTLELGKFVGEKAHLLFSGGRLVSGDGTFAEALAQTKQLMRSPAVPAIFEAAFEHDGVRIRVDVLERLQDGSWGLREVKSSTGPKDQHYPDIAVQLYVLRGCGLRVRSIELVHVNGAHVRGKELINWRRYFTRVDVKELVEAQLPEIEAIVHGQREILRRDRAPRVRPAHHCHQPNSCEFWDRCTAKKPEDWIFHLPRLRAERFAELQKAGVSSIANIPDDYPLSESQAVIRRVLRSGRAEVSRGLRRALRGFGPPALYLDFETMNPAVPLYPGTSPYQRIPFQWSLHALGRRDQITHTEFLADPGGDPRPAFLSSLLKAAGSSTSPIVVYSSFEKAVLTELATCFPRQRKAIANLQSRLRDLLGVVRQHIYDPAFGFSYSIKDVAPALCDQVLYDDLEVVADGGAASWAFERLASGRLEPEENPESIRQALLTYCQRDTLAMLELHRALRAHLPRRRP